MKTCIYLGRMSAAVWLSTGRMERDFSRNISKLKTPVEEKQFKYGFFFNSSGRGDLIQIDGRLTAVQYRELVES